MTVSSMIANVFASSLRMFPGAAETITIHGVPLTAFRSDVSQRASFTGSELEENYLGSFTFQYSALRGLEIHAGMRVGVGGKELLITAEPVIDNNQDLMTIHVGALSGAVGAAAVAAVLMKPVYSVNSMGDTVTTWVDAATLPTVDVRRITASDYVDEADRMASASQWAVYLPPTDIAVTWRIRLASGTLLSIQAIDDQDKHPGLMVLRCSEVV